MQRIIQFNSLRPRQNGHHFADDIFKCIFLNENVWIPSKTSLKFVPKGPINNIPALVQIMAWRRPDDKPLSELMTVSLLTHICVTRPQWVKSSLKNCGCYICQWWWLHRYTWNTKWCRHQCYHKLNSVMLGCSITNVTSWIATQTQRAAIPEIFIKSCPPVSFNTWILGSFKFCGLFLAAPDTWQRSTTFVLFKHFMRQTLWWPIRSLANQHT